MMSVYKFLTWVGVVADSSNNNPVEQFFSEVTSVDLVTELTQDSIVTSVRYKHWKYSFEYRATALKFGLNESSLL